MKKRKSFWLATLMMFVLSLLLGGCSTVTETQNQKLSPSVNTTETVTLRITKDYGRTIIVDSQEAFQENWTVYDLLETKADIETDYGGSFISGINGIISMSSGLDSERKDWFYYINGTCSDVGALDYELKSGDTVWWDYHSWKGMNSGNAAVIGLYPEPFIHGYRHKTNSVLIMADTSHEELAEWLSDSLTSQGGKTVVIESMNETEMKNREQPVIVLGLWENLKEFEYIQGLNKNYDKTGSFIHYDSKIELVNSEGDISQTLEKGLTVTSYGEGLGDENPLWLIMAMDDESLKEGIKKLADFPDSVDFMYSAYYNGDKFEPLPIMDLP